jgi:hypothetical protein
LNNDCIGAALSPFLKKPLRASSAWWIALGSIERGFLVQDIEMVRHDVADGQIVGADRI